MNPFHQYRKTIMESTNFTNWIRPALDDIKHEYKIEYEIKSLKHLTNDAFPTFNDFKVAVDNAEEKIIDNRIDSTIEYRSHTKNKNSLLSLIRTYRSYPEFRNEKTIEAIYDGFKSNSPMKMPIVLRFPNKNLRIMGGNTRMDIAQHLGIKPKVLIVDVPGV